jgi:hypothetical protein
MPAGAGVGGLEMDDAHAPLPLIPGAHTAQQPLPLVSSLTARFPADMDKAEQKTGGRAFMNGVPGCQFQVLKE